MSDTNPTIPAEDHRMTLEDVAWDGPVRRLLARIEDLEARVAALEAKP